MVSLALLVPGPLAQPLPAMALPDMNGQMHNLQDLRNQKVVINLWATWCGPCRREMPMLEQAARQNPDVRFLFVNQGESAATIENYLRQEKLDLSQWIRLDPDSTCRRSFVRAVCPQRCSLVATRCNGPRWARSVAKC
ncbi:TlpA family protein disulfide reductase [Advenella kashmirensis]|nr:TlpA disulfide reductase family protein [Advenella kashmirensis]